MNKRQSPQLQKTTTSDHANIIDCFQNVLHVSLMRILFIEIFIVTFINDCAQGRIYLLVQPPGPRTPCLRDSNITGGVLGCN